jgi:hypothetical protein
MTTAKDYAVYFPYGATSAPYSKAHPHRGEDRCNKLGVPVAIGSTTIGLVGATGEVYDSQGNKGTPAAAHLHIQEWSGSYANTRKPQNSFKGGKVINVDLNGTQGDGSFGKFISIQTSDGWVDSYCHLSKVNVKVGQVISGTATPTTGGSKVTTAEATSMITALTKKVFGKTIDTGGMANYVGHVTSGTYTPGKAVTEIFDSPQAQAYLKSKYQTTKTVTNTVEKIVRDPADIKKIDELSKALEIAQKNAGTGSNEDISYIRQKVDQIFSFLTGIFKGKE